MEWEAYLEQKKINAAVYKQQDPQQYEEFSKLFYQMHPNSFTAQKLFLINGIRRMYPLKVAEAEESSIKKAAKPVFKPKPKL